MTASGFAARCWRPGPTGRSSLKWAGVLDGGVQADLQQEGDEHHRQHQGEQVFRAAIQEAADLGDPHAGQFPGPERHVALAVGAQIKKISCRFGRLSRKIHWRYGRRSGELSNGKVDVVERDVCAV